MTIRIRFGRLGLTVALAMTGTLLASGCGLQAASEFRPDAEPGSIEEVPSLEGVPITVGSKDFTEQLVLGKIAVVMLDVAGADVSDQTGIAGSVAARKAEEQGDISGYWEYTGTAWGTYLGHENLIADKDKLAQRVREEDLAKNGIVWLDYAPMNNTYAMAIRAEKAKELGVETLSDMAELPVEEQTFCLESEFASRSDGFQPMLKKYGIQDKVPDGQVKVMDTGVVYSETDKGQTCNFGEVFTTDGRIQALDLVPMEDDKHYFPLYNVAMTFKEPLVSEHPELREMFAEVSAKLDDATLQRLNGQVDIEGREPALVARDWLRKEGFVN